MNAVALLLNPTEFDETQDTARDLSFTSSDIVDPFDSNIILSIKCPAAIHTHTVSHTILLSTVNTEGQCRCLFSTNHCCTDLRKNFFCKKVIKPWNSVPAELHHFDSP